MSTRSVTAKACLSTSLSDMCNFKGKAGELIDRGDNTYGGKWVINPSGGLISKGHPIGATGDLKEIVNLTHAYGLHESFRRRSVC